MTRHLKPLAAILSLVLLFAAPTNHAAFTPDNCYVNDQYGSSAYFNAQYFNAGCAAASFVLTGLPLSGDWEPWYDVSLLNEFIDIKQQECDGDAVWAKWR